MILRYIKINFRKVFIGHKSLIFSRSFKLSNLNRNSQKNPSWIVSISKQANYFGKDQVIKLNDNQNDKCQYSHSIQTLLKVKKQSVEVILQNIKKDLRSMQNYENFLKGSNLKIFDIINMYSEILQENRKILEKGGENHITLHSVSFYFDYLLAYLQDKAFQKMNEKKRIITFFEIAIKMKSCSQILHNFKDKSDIIANNQSEKSKKVWQKCIYQKLKGKNRLKYEYLLIKKLLHVVTAANVKRQKYQNFIIKNIVFICALPWYFLSHYQSKLLSLTFYRNPNLLMTQNLCNIPQTRLLKQLSNIFFQGIHTNIELYIPTSGNYDDNIDIFSKNDNSIIVRLLHCQKVHRYSLKNIQKPMKEQKYFEQVIVHIHGGGFIALSSNSSQNFTRRWSNTLEIPVFSIDYRMPPQHPFPTAPWDCFNVYRFLVHHIHKYLNIKPKQVFIAGDSAGGNLACSLTALILKHKQLTPKGLYLIYPALDLRLIFTSSRLHTFTDPLLQPSMLLLCLEAYLGDINNSSDPLASPILLTQEYINGSKDGRFPLEWPRTIVTVGDKDPVYDDSLLLMQKMVQSKINCQCIIYQQLTHGYLNMALLINECKKTVENSVAHLRKLMKKSN